MQVYDIAMQTPIGIRKGCMTLFADEKKVFGNLNILKHDNPFSGLCSPEGGLHLEGNMTTLFRTIHYVADGSISPCGLELTLVEPKNVFHIVGTLCSDASKGE